MIIIDVNGKSRNIESYRKILHTIQDKDGNDVLTDYIEVVIIGRFRRNWKEWYPLKDFRRFNPNIII